MSGLSSAPGPARGLHEGLAEASHEHHDRRADLLSSPARPDELQHQDRPVDRPAVHGRVPEGTGAAAATRSPTRAPPSRGGSATSSTSCGLVPPAVCTMRQQMDRTYENFKAKTTQPREVHLPDEPAGPQRDALLPPGPRAHRRDDADRLHAGRRRGVPEVLPHLPARPRPLHRLRGPGPHRGDPAERRDPAPLGDRGDRRRADPGPRRPGRGRDGHPDRQALPLHPLRGRSRPTARSRSRSTSGRTTRSG